MKKIDTWLDIQKYVVESLKHVHLERSRLGDVELWARPARRRRMVRFRFL